MLKRYLDTLKEHKKEIRDNMDTKLAEQTTDMNTRFAQKKIRTNEICT